MEPPASDLFAMSAEGDLAEKTAKAPSLVAPGMALATAGPGTPQLTDFVLLRELGRGSFARVFLAHQVSLDRKVALKVSHLPSRNEGQTLAGLDHEHIVKVYAEFTDAATKQRGLVLQYVPGTNLGQVVQELFKEGQRPRFGREILKAVDQLAQDGVEFDPAALRDRDLFSRENYLAAVCRLGSRLAQALGYAHARGVLHCDIKPANILLSRYGRPLLADFNVSVSLAVSAEGSGLGGTLLYMAPEQIAAFAQKSETNLISVDHRADLYSLALVLLETLCGHLPKIDGHPTDMAEGFRRMRCQSPEQWLARESQQVPRLVWRVLRRCLDPDPQQRYANAEEFANALTNAAALVEGRRRLPAEGQLSRWARRRPLTCLIVLTLLPHLAASGVNIAYNTGQIPLNAGQRQAFGTVILWYNVLMYPLCLAFGLWMLRPLALAFRWPEALASLPNAELDGLRRRTLALGRWGIVLALLGWLPGSIFFPLALNYQAGPVTPNIYGHFFLSFALSGLIALIYSYFGIQFVALRGMYPRLVHADQDPEEVRGELHGIGRGLGWLQVLAALVPLVGAVLLLVLAPVEFTLAFRLLAVALIGAGMLGLGVAVLMANYLRQLVEVLSAALPQPGHDSSEAGDPSLYLGHNKISLGDGSGGITTRG